MSDEFAATIATLQSHLQKQEDEVRSTKRLINQLCQRGGTALLFPEAEADSPAATGTFRRDQFYGVPLAAAIRKYLEMRRTLGPATVNDIYTALRAGGFVFEAKNEANAKRALYISLGKNTSAFHKLPGASDELGVFGLREWYPNAKADQESKPTKKPKKKPTKAASKTSTTKRATNPPATDTPAASTKEPEKGVSNEKGSSADSAARKKHNPTPVA